MRRISSAIFLVFCALALASPAQADRGDKWRAWRDRHQGDRQGQPPPIDQPPANNPPANDYPPAANDQNGDQQYDNDRRGDDGRPWLGRREHDRAREGVIRGRMMPLEDLENRIGRSTPGFRIGNPELLMFGGRPVYRMRWRTPGGRILIVFADAETGQVLDIRGR